MKARTERREKERKKSRWRTDEILECTVQGYKSEIQKVMEERKMTGEVQ